MASLELTNTDRTLNFNGPEADATAPVRRLVDMYMIPILFVILVMYAVYAIKI